MTMRRNAVGTFELPISAAQAGDFFTPEGERIWDPGWDPSYPAGKVSETPGTVFITVQGNVETIWVIENIDRTSHAFAYCRITPGVHAGTVRVRCFDQPEDQCVVTVEYDMTALSPDLPWALDDYTEDSFSALIQQWSEALRQSL